MTTATTLRRLAPLALFLLAGCGSEEDRIKLVPVTGTVTENGKPMANATITFTPASDNAFSTPGVDSTGPEGNFKIRFKNRAGLAPGKYRVVIEPGLESAEAKIPDAFQNDPYMGQMSLGKIPGQKREGKDAAKLKNEFEAEVEAAGNNEFDFDVKSATTKVASNK